MSATCLKHVRSMACLWHKSESCSRHVTTMTNTRFGNDSGMNWKKKWTLFLHNLNVFETCVRRVWGDVLERIKYHLDLLQTCIENVSDMKCACCRHNLHMFQTCSKDVLNMFQTFARQTLNILSLDQGKSLWMFEAFIYWYQNAFNQSTAQWFKLHLSPKLNKHESKGGRGIAWEEETMVWHAMTST